MKRFVLASVLALSALAARADAGALLGITYAIGSNNGIGFSVLVTSTRHEERGVVAAGISFFPFAENRKFGIPVGVGYQGNNAGAVVGYDFLQLSPVIMGGYVDTRDSHKDRATLPPAPPEV